MRRKNEDPKFRNPECGTRTRHHFAPHLSSNRQWTTYFRRQFYVPHPALVTPLNARLTRDDAVVIYLNGAEVWRDTNLTSGTITFTTPALVALSGADETNWLTKPSAPRPLSPAGTRSPPKSTTRA